MLARRDWFTRGFATLANRRHKVEKPTSGNVRIGWAFAFLLLGTGLTAMAVQSVLSEWGISQSLMSREWWESAAERFHASRAELADGVAPVSLAPLLFATTILSVGLLALGSLAAAAWRRMPLVDVATDWMDRGWRWWLLPGLWEILRVISRLTGWETLEVFLIGSLPLWFAAASAGWLTALLQIAAPPALPRSATTTGETAHEVPRWRRHCGLLTVLLFALLYCGAFVWMNWQMYFNLDVPHGDSGMYEEHLWNVTHGKGFRSYLDDGRLFLGEHLQVVHLLLLPLYLLWPSHLLLELCESVALAAGAIPVFWIARRHSGCTRSAILLAAAYLLYVPLHFLDIAIDGKTFRPTSFGVPALLFALDQMERGRFGTMLIPLLLALSAKEDYAVMIFCLGVWLAFQRNRTDSPPGDAKRRKIWGIALAVFGAVYLLVAVKFAIPFFRGGDVHYARYFGELGSSPGDILQSAIHRPGLVLGKLFSLRSLMYALYLLLPVGFLPLRSATRLAVAAPWFGVLCLLELTADPAQQQPLVPGHHFHAPLVPVLFWSAAAGLGDWSTRQPAWWRFRILGGRRVKSNGTARCEETSNWWAGFCFSSAFFTAVLMGYAPLSLGFWDRGSPAYWKTRYVPNERARAFPAVLEVVPQDARVFSTDFVHTRFTHYKRSYDYSEYPRASDEELTEPRPGEKYYIVFDVYSRYNRNRAPEEQVRRPEDIPEYADHPGEWEVVSHPAERFFIVLRRRETVP